MKLQVINLLNKFGHDIKYRIHIEKSGYQRIYIMSIDGVKYTTRSADQVAAFKKIKELSE